MFVSFNVLTVSSVNLYTVYASIIYCISCCIEYCTATSLALQPSVLWRCWLGSRKGIRPVKTEWWCADMVICLEQGADLHMAQLMPLPLTVSCFSKIQIGFTFLVTAHPGSLDKGPLNGVCVRACVRVVLFSVIPKSRDSCLWHFFKHSVHNT